MPAQQIKIDNTVIRQSPFSPGQNSTILTQDGVYIVGGPRRIGDSRGNEWYSEITGLTSNNGRLGLAGPNGNTPIGLDVRDPVKQWTLINRRAFAWR